MKPLIILSNDDGIESDGLRVLYEAVKELGDIIIAAPDRQRSGASHALSVIEPIKVKKVKFGRAKAYAVSGTPVDCAKIALLSLAKRKPAVFLSGVNHGPNIAQFILYSGTIGAGAEAAILGIPAAAFSIDSYEPSEWGFARDFIRDFTGKVLKKSIPLKKHTLINVNLPHLRRGQVKGVKILPRGGNEFREKYRPVNGWKAGKAVFMHEILERTGSKGIYSDAAGVEKGYVTVTPLKFDLNDCKYLNKMKKAGIRL